MPLNEPKNQVPSQMPSTVEPPITPAEHREHRQFQSDADRLAENFAKALNDGVKRGELPGV
jgi:hypothetical protein